MHVHVVPPVGVPRGTAPNTFSAESGFGGDSTGLWVVDGVFELEPVKSCVTEYPLGQCDHGLGAESAPSRAWDHPIGDVGTAVP